MAGYFTTRNLRWVTNGDPVTLILSSWVLPTPR